MGGLVSCSISYTIYRRIVYVTYKYISQFADHNVVSPRSPAHRRTSLLAPSRILLSRLEGSYKGGTIFSIRGFSKIPEYFTLRDWPEGFQSCVQSRKSLQRSFSTGDTSARILSFSPVALVFGDIPSTENLSSFLLSCLQRILSRGLRSRSNGRCQHTLFTSRLARSD